MPDHAPARLMLPLIAVSALGLIYGLVTSTPLMIGIGVVLLAADLVIWWFDPLTKTDADGR